MSLARYARTFADSSQAEKQAALRNQPICIVARAATGTAGEVKRFTNLKQALDYFGRDRSAGNNMPFMLQKAFKYKQDQELFCVSAGTGAYSGLSATLSVDHDAGAATLEVSDIGTIADGAGIDIGEGDFMERRYVVGSPSGSTITLNYPLDFAHLEEDTVKEFTAPAIADYQTARANLLEYERINLTRVYIDDFYADETNLVDDSTDTYSVKRFLETLELRECFAYAFYVYKEGDNVDSDIGTHVTLGEIVNHKRILPLVGDFKFVTPRGYTDNFGWAALMAAFYASRIGNFRAVKQALLTNADIAIEDCAGFTNFTLETTLPAIVEAGGTTIYKKRIDGRNGFRIFQDITSYNFDSGDSPSEIYGNFSDVSIEDFARERILEDWVVWNAKLNKANTPLTADSRGVELAEARVMSVITRFVEFDPDYAPTVTAAVLDQEHPEIGPNAMEITIVYRAVNLANQIGFTIQKQVK